MKKLFIDVDGVIRDLDYAVLGKRDAEWATHVEGLPFIDYVTKHKDRILVNTPGTAYCTELQFLFTLLGFKSFTFLTAQPLEWRPYTEKWLQARFPGIPIIYTHSPSEKLVILEKADGLLIEDYPFFKDYSRIVLVDHKYNRDVDCRRITTVEEFADLVLQF